MPTLNKRTHRDRALLALSVASGTALLALTQVPLVASFLDVPRDHPFHEAIEFLQEQRIIQGYDDGTFRPESTINRAEMVKILLGSLTDGYQRIDCMNKAGFRDLFEDVSEARSVWFGPYLCVAKSRGVVEGYADGTFRPSREITVAESAALLTRGFRLALPLAVPGDEWFVRHLDALEYRGYLPGSVDRFDPHRPITRGEFAEITFRIIQADPSVLPERPDSLHGAASSRSSSSSSRGFSSSSRSSRSSSSSSSSSSVSSGPPERTVTLRPHVPNLHECTAPVETLAGGFEHLRTAMIDPEQRYAYVGGPGNITRIRLEDFTVDGVIQIGDDYEVTASAMDPVFGEGFFAMTNFAQPTRPVRVVRVALNDFEITGTANLDSSQTYALAAAMGKDGNTLYVLTSGQGDQLSKIALYDFREVAHVQLVNGTSPTAAVVGAIAMDPGGKFATVGVGGYLVHVWLPDMEVAERIILPGQGMRSVAVDGGTAFFGSHAGRPQSGVVRFFLDRFGLEEGDALDLSEGLGYAIQPTTVASFETEDGYAFFGASDYERNDLLKIDLYSFNDVDRIPLDLDDGQGGLFRILSMAYDRGRDEILVGTSRSTLNAPARLLKVKIGEMTCE